MVCVLGARGHAGIEARGDVLTVVTERLTATFRGGDLVSLANAPTGERYVQTAEATSLLAVNLTQSTGETLRTDGWKLAAGNPGTARIVLQDSVRTAWMEVEIDAGTQEIVIRVAGQSKRAGVTGVVWGLAGLDLTSGRLVLPAHAGGVLDRNTFPGSLQLDYPTRWEAQMAVYQAAQGSLLVYSRDATALFKNLLASGRGGGTIDLKFETAATAPWASAAEVPAVEWRLNTFRGDWRAPAAAYRAWLESVRPLVPADGARAWVRQIRAVVILHSLDAGALDALVRKLTPAKTLLYLPNWRKDAYDVNYPDYTPASSTPALVARAQALGFRVMLHTNIVGVSPANPDYQAMRQFQVKQPLDLSPVGWWWDRPAETTPQRHAFINPASSAYRSLFIARLRPAIEAVHPDAIHLDVSAPMFNDGNGLIEGMNYAQGSIALHRALLAAFPDVVFGGESMHELLAPFNWFAQRWVPDSPPDWPPHPISTYLMGGHVMFYGYLGQPNPDDPGYKRYAQQYEGQGVAPTPVVSAVADVGDDRPGMARLLRQVRAWQQHDLQPNWDTDWGGALFRYRGADGAVAVTDDSGTLVRLRVDQETLYQRAHSTSTAHTSFFVDGWPAYDDTGVYGLDPERQYWLDAIARPIGQAHLTRLPPDVRLGPATVVAPDAAGFELLPIEKQLFDFFGSLWLAKTGTTFAGVDGPLAYGATAYLTQITVGGQSRRCLFAHPPYQGVSGGETFIEYTVAIPNAADVALQFEAGLNDAATLSDGVTFRVAIEGGEAWREHIRVGGWHAGSVSLTRHAGRTIRVRFITHPGPALNTNYDWAVWSNMRLVAPQNRTATDLTLVLPPDARPEFSGAAQFNLAAGAATISGLAPPGRFFAFFQPGKPVASGQKLFDFPFSAWKASSGELPVAGSVYGSGSISSLASGGVRKSPTINGHPPQDGQTLLCWALRLPENDAMKLSLSAGVGDGACTTGVSFAVRVNGETAWQWQTKAPGWQDGTVDLSAWRGRNVFLQLLTDSMGENSCDWGHWAGLSFSSSASPPGMNPQGVVNAATFAPVALAPGALASVFGERLAEGTGQAASLPLPTELAGASIRINGVAAPLLYVSAGQVNFQVPWGIRPGAVTLTVSRSGLAGNPVTAQIAEYSPGIFAVVHASDYSAVSAASPVTAGEVLVIYANGLGPVARAVATGEAPGAQPSTTISAPAVTIGNVSGVTEFAGLAPGLVGVYQVNVRTSASTPSGDRLPLALTIAGLSSPVLPISVR
jgi:uncharacterized protein (TIGR03437 family)